MFYDEYDVYKAQKEDRLLEPPEPEPADPCEKCRTIKESVALRVDDDSFMMELCDECFEKMTCPGCGLIKGDAIDKQFGLCPQCLYEEGCAIDWPEDELALHLSEVQEFKNKDAIKLFEKRLKKV